DVGRPDLAQKATNMTQEDLAGMLFDSLRNRIMPLADDIMVYPAHGAGSACGKNMSSDTQDLLGNQKRTNYALRADMTKEEFIKEVTTGILPPPAYFPLNAAMNKNGYDSIDEVIARGTKALSLDEFKQEIANGALILDVRTQAEFIKGFIPNSLFIGLNGQFAMWVGAIIQDIKQRIVLITPEGKEEETVTRLARVGYDYTVGYLKGGIDAWDGELNTITSISAEELEATPNCNIVDVRKPGEWQSEHVENAMHYPLDYMNDDLNKLDKNTTYHIHCAGGYRSVIAISLLMQHGYKNLIDVAGGYGAIKNTSIPKTNYTCPSTL
ncbi:MAG TPA: rhodanese-like domain-containing protein, partial [Taishania sp.]|nr:rhodanese-like domain-containing protein [Taishania sp.]